MSEERYKLNERIGHGGIGEVYKGYDTQLKRVVAIKRVLTSETPEDENAEQNLLNEATTLSALQHPNIVTIFDIGKQGDAYFVVMELLKGETIDATIKRGALTFHDFNGVVSQTLEGLIAAHATGLIHRDLKPSNIMLTWTASGRFQLKILDFGLAKFSKQPSVQTMDQENAIMGSIYFMAPEQFERKPLDQKVDLYSLGCIYYYVLTGSYPFQGDSAAQVMSSHLQHKVTHLKRLRDDLPNYLCNWVMKLISRHPEDRPNTAKETLNLFFNKTSGIKINKKKAKNASKPVKTAPPAPKITKAKKASAKLVSGNTTSQLILKTSSQKKTAKFNTGKITGNLTQSVKTKPGKNPYKKKPKKKLSPDELKHIKTITFVSIGLIILLSILIYLISQ